MGGASEAVVADYTVGDEVPCARRDVIEWQLESERFDHEFEIPENKVAQVVKQLGAELGRVADRKVEGSYTTFSANGADWMIMDHGRGTASITADG